MIEVKNIFHSYQDKQYVVEDVSFTIDKGEIFGFLGPSGAGKTTVQNLMIGLLPLKKGQILFDGNPITRAGADFYNHIGVSFEDPTLYTKLTGFENLKYYAGLFSVPTKDPLRLLESVGLKDAANNRASTYSKGMKQRLVFIRSLINNPDILFLDEPTAGLDPNLAKVIKEIILEQKRNQKTIFLTTHNMFIAEELCDRVAFINEGRLLATDSPRSLKLKYGNRSVKVDFLKNNQLKQEVFFLDRDSDLEKFSQLVNSKKVQTIHTQEASLEQIFIKLTGRKLV